MNNRIYDIINRIPETTNLWGGSHKIPWNDPDFSARILREHLSQDHNLASRKQQYIEAQTAWISSALLGGTPATILDLGCGPGLYSHLMAGDDHTYYGIDFSPASIEYAVSNYRVPGRIEFSLGDVVEADYPANHDLVTMLYGELNVFSPAQCRRILTKAYDALAPGGRLLIERQRTHMVRGAGEGPATWTRAESGGLFSNNPYVCLTENRWFDVEGVSLQCFHVLEQDSTEVVTYRSTTKAWTGSEMEGLLIEAGFTDIRHHEDWPVPDDSLTAMSALKK